VWQFRDRQGRDRSVKVGGSIHANSGGFLAALAVEGQGIAYEPDFIVAPEVRSGRLVPLLRGFEAYSANIYVVYPSRRHLSAKVRTFADFMTRRYASADWALLPPAR
jgi:DNA-binding transcriptional LysR family regulator